MPSFHKLAPSPPPSACIITHSFPPGSNLIFEPHLILNGSPVLSTACSVSYLFNLLHALLCLARMQCYTELTPPTAVTHSLSLSFLSPTANNLVVVKTSLLQIFSLKSIISAPENPRPGSKVESHIGLPNGKDTGSATIRPERVQTTKLVLVAQYELAGTVTSIARVKILRSKSGGEALLVALRNAKLSLVEWDPERYTLSTISIHYYEREDILASPWEPDLGQCSSILSVDPGSRCAIFKFGARHLAILPFHQAGDDIAMDDYDQELDGGKLERKTSIVKGTEDEDTNRTPYGASFVLSLLALDSTLTHPIHLSFLHEYREPTFGILSSQATSSIALLGERRDNVSYAVYNLDLEQRASTTLLTVNKLPYDLFEVIPLSRIIGGALLVGCNELIHVDQSGKTNGVAVNESTKQCTSFALADQSDLELRLEGCLIKQLGFDTPELLIIQPSGALLILSFKIDGRSVSGLSLRGIIPDHSPLLSGASCASSIGRGRMFIGSEDADSVVLGWSRPSDRLKRKRSRIDMDIDDDAGIVDLDDIEVEDDEDDLYADDKPESSDKTKDAAFSTPASEDDYKFRVHDSLLNVGPMTDVAFGVVSHDEEFSRKATRSGHELMTASGRGRAGALMSFRKDIHPHTIHEYPISSANTVWSISASKRQEIALADADRFDNYVVAAFDDRKGKPQSQAYVISDGRLEDVKNTDFDPDAGAAVEVGTLNGGTRIVQVLPTEVRTYDAGMYIVPHFTLLFCYFLAPLITVHMSMFNIVPLLGYHRINVVTQILRWILRVPLVGPKCHIVPIQYIFHP